MLGNNRLAFYTFAFLATAELLSASSFPVDDGALFKLDVGILPNLSHAQHNTLQTGAPIGDKFNSLLVGPRGPNLLADVPFLEEIAHFNRERIPERVVHAKGAAAYGHFVVTNTEITKYSKATLFAAERKKTPVVARFSHVTGESGIADTVPDFRGFAVKFYTDSGNWDLVGNNFPVFFIRDPINFASFVHSQKRNPKTHLKDPDAFWDFISMVPESLHATTMLFSERGIPDGFRHMHGYGVNTFKLINSRNEAFYAKFHWICNQTIKNLDIEKATKVAGLDPDYMVRDLQVNIAKGNAPSWTLKFQVMTIDAAEKADFNVLDVTKTWPTAKFPLIEIGTMTLDQNADNYFAQVEQLAFSPANMVPGIEASPDKMLMGRIFAYSDAQRYRLGANFVDIPSNMPKCPVFAPTYNDGVTFRTNFKGELPNYVPSIKYPKIQTHDDRYVEHYQQVSGRVGRFDLGKDDNYSQAKILVNKVLTKDGRAKLAASIAGHLKYVSNKEIVAKVLAHFSEIRPDLSKAIEAGMKKDTFSPILN